jgi:hypothetical protein
VLSIEILSTERGSLVPVQSETEKLMSSQLHDHDHEDHDATVDSDHLRAQSESYRDENTSHQLLSDLAVIAWCQDVPFSACPVETFNLRWARAMYVILGYIEYAGADIEAQA